MSKKGEKEELRVLRQRVKDLFVCKRGSTVYPEEMVPFIGEKYLKHKILVIDCCLACSSESGNMNKARCYYANKHPYHIEESVKDQVDSDNPYFGLKAVLRALDSGIDKESVIFHSFIVRPIKRNELFENYFPKRIGQSIDDETVSFFDKLKKIDKKEGATMLLRLIHLCRPRLIIFLGLPLYLLVCHSLLALRPNHFNTNVKESTLRKWVDYCVKLPTDKWPKKMKENSLKKRMDDFSLTQTKGFVDTFFFLKGIGTYAFDGFVYLEKKSDGLPLFPLQLKKDNSNVVDEKGKAFVERNKIHPWYEEFDLLLYRLSQNFEAVSELKQDKLKDEKMMQKECEFDETLEKIDLLVRKMLTENLDKDKFDPRANRSNNISKGERKDK